jgi:hypothetical protein
MRVRDGTRVQDFVFEMRAHNMFSSSACKPATQNESGPRPQPNESTSRTPASAGSLVASGEPAEARSLLAAVRALAFLDHAAATIP